MNNCTLAPDHEQAIRFLNRLAGNDEKTFTFQTFDDNQDRKDTKLTRMFHGTYDEHKDTLAALNARGAGVFVTVNKTDLKGRKKENIIGIRAIWVEYDHDD